jgi:hypothetical protein
MGRRPPRPCASAPPAAAVAAAEAAAPDAAEAGAWPSATADATWEAVLLGGGWANEGGGRAGREGVEARGEGERDGRDGASRSATSRTGVGRHFNLPATSSPYLHRRSEADNSSCPLLRCRWTGPGVELRLTAAGQLALGRLPARTRESGAGRRRRRFRPSRLAVVQPPPVAPP